MPHKKNPLYDLHEDVEAARRFRELAHDPTKRKRRDVLVPLFRFFESQLPLVGFVPMQISAERLEKRLRKKLPAVVRKEHQEDLARLKQQETADRRNVASGGIPQDLLKFVMAYPPSVSRPQDTSRPGLIAFWQQQQDEMAKKWGCEATHVSLGLDLTTSAFLRNLHHRLSLPQKQRFLQEFRDNDWKFADEIKADGFNHPLDGVPNFRTQVHLEINPPLGSLAIEKAYHTWADGHRELNKRVKQPLLKLVTKLRKPLSPYDMEEALIWYGSDYDPARSNKEHILWLAACVVAGEEWRDGAFELDEGLAQRVRTAMRADKKFDAAAS